MIPNDYIDAARIDGASELRIFFLVILPSVKPAIATLLIIKFMWSWNEFFWPMVVISSPQMKVVTMGLMSFTNMYFIEYNLLTAAAVISILPILLIFITLQRWVVQAVVMSGLKGWSDGLRLAGLRPGRDGVGRGLPGVGDFDPGQPVPKGFPDRTALAYAAAAFMLVAGAAVEWRRTAAWGAAALTAYYALIVVILMNGRVVLAHYAEFGSYSGARRAARDRGGRADRLRRQRQDRCGPGRTPHAPGPTGVRGLCAVIRRSAFFLHEPHRPVGPQMAAAYARVLGLCDRGWPDRGGRCDPDGRAGPPCRDPANRHVSRPSPCWFTRRCSWPIPPAV